MDEIGDRHLNNIINMLQRSYLNELSLGCQASSFLRGEMAIASVDNAMDDLEIEFHEIVTPFIEEQKRRQKEIGNE